MSVPTRLRHTVRPLHPYIVEWLQQKHTTLWGEAFTVTEDDRAALAADWLIEQIDSFNAYMEDGAQ